MELAQALVEDARTLLAIAVGGFWAAIAVILGSSLACLGFSVLTALSRVPSARPRRTAPSAWR